MRYVTASMGAIFIFLGFVLISLVINVFLPPALQRPITIPVGLLRFSATPAPLIGIALGIVGAIHSYRSTLKRYDLKSRAKPEASLVD